MRAQAHLVEARRRRSAKDAPANRAAVHEYLAAIDAILDMYLDIDDLGLYEIA